LDEGGAAAGKSQGEHREPAAGLCKAVDTELTPRQRKVFVAIVLDDVPPDALVLSLSSSRNAICKLLLTPGVSSGPPLLLAGICPMTLRGAHERLAGTGPLLAD